MRLPILFALGLVPCMQAQTSASIVDVGPTRYHQTFVAPGQVVTLTLRGLTTQFDATQFAKGFPLPTDFKGLSVMLEQTGSAPVPVPLLHGDGLSSCGAPPITSTSQESITFSQLACNADPMYALNLQIPYSLKPNKPGVIVCTGNPCITGLNDAVLTIREAGCVGRSLRIYPVADQVHLLNTCDDRVMPPPQLIITSDYTTKSCTHVVTHADGSWVTFAAPAKSGENLTAYAFGLGAPDSAVDAVTGPSTSIAVTRDFQLTFSGISRFVSKPSYTGLVMGSAGMYQINFQAPVVPADLPGCTSANPTNMTMTVQGTASLDQASFCIVP